jgi:hypothetical protein
MVEEQDFATYFAVAYNLLVAVRALAPKAMPTSAKVTDVALKMLEAVVNGTLKFETPDPDVDTAATRRLIKDMVERLKKQPEWFKKTSMDVVLAYGATDYAQAVRVCAECDL